MRRLVVVATAIAAILALGSATALAGHPANLVHNGSFERPEVDGTFDTYPADGTIPRWTVGGTVDITEEPAFDAVRGTQSPQALDLNGTGPGSVSQSIATEEGQDYLLSFFLAGNPGCAPALKVLDVSWDGALVATFYYDTTGQAAGDLNYQLRTLELTAEAGAATELKFAGTNAGCGGPMIDVVRVTEI